MTKLSFKKNKWTGLSARTHAFIRRFWLKRLISGPKSYRDFQETGQWTSTALFRYLSLLVARVFYTALFLYEEFLLEGRTEGIWVQMKHQGSDKKLQPSFKDYSRTTFDFQG